MKAYRREQVFSDWDELNAHIVSLVADRIFILCDENTRKHCLPVLRHKVKGCTHAPIIELGAGEEFKNIESCTFVWKELARLGADRSSLLINLGGGVICDTGGFVASVFKRGIRYIHVPTTLLAMADAAIGGKCGVDFDSLKNLIGLFGRPKGVMIDPQFLRSLPYDQLNSGFAEVVKIALLSQGTLWQEFISDPDLRNHPPADIIIRAIQLKQDFVEQDPYESGKRKLLNFGHTAGHAAESLMLKQGRPGLHGEAVAWGMIAAIRLSTMFTGFNLKEGELVIENLISWFNLPEIRKAEIPEIVSFMQHDKKNSQGKIRFTLLKGIGDGVWDVGIDTNQLLALADEIFQTID